MNNTKAMYTDNYISIYKLEQSKYIFKCALRHKSDKHLRETFYNNTSQLCRVVRMSFFFPK